MRTPAGETQDFVDALGSYKLNFGPQFAEGYQLIRPVYKVSNLDSILRFEIADSFLLLADKAEKVSTIQREDVRRTVPIDCCRKAAGRLREAALKVTPRAERAERRLQTKRGWHIHVELSGALPNVRATLASMQQTIVPSIAGIRTLCPQPLHITATVRVLSSGNGSQIFPVETDEAWEPLPREIAAYDPQRPGVSQGLGLVQGAQCVWCVVESPPNEKHKKWLGKLQALGVQRILWIPAWDSKAFNKLLRWLLGKVVSLRENWWTFLGPSKWDAVALCDRALLTPANESNPEHARPERVLLFPLVALPTTGTDLLQSFHLPFARALPNGHIVFWAMLRSTDPADLWGSHYRERPRSMLWRANQWAFQSSPTTVDAQTVLKGFYGKLDRPPTPRPRKAVGEPSSRRLPGEMNQRWPTQPFIIVEGAIRGASSGELTLFVNDVGLPVCLTNGDAASVAHAFMHFSFVQSQGYCVVANLRGQEQTLSTFVLTTPTVHTRGGMGFKRQDRGCWVMHQCLAGHRCGHLCRALGLPPVTLFAKL
eukprot:gene30843-37268_t